MVVSAIASPSRKLLARLFRHLEWLVRAGVCQAGELARHLSPHLGRFSDGGPAVAGEAETLEPKLEPKELVVPLEAMIGHCAGLFGAS